MTRRLLLALAFVAATLYSFEAAACCEDCADKSVQELCGYPESLRCPMNCGGTCNSQHQFAWYMTSDGGEKCSPVGNSQSLCTLNTCYNKSCYAAYQCECGGFFECGEGNTVIIITRMYCVDCDDSEQCPDFPEW